MNTLQELETTLDAAHAYLEALAARELGYRHFLAVNRIADRAAAGLLAVQELPAEDDDTAESQPGLGAEPDEAYLADEETTLVTEIDEEVRVDDLPVAGASGAGQLAASSYAAPLIEPLDTFDLLLDVPPTDVDDDFSEETTDLVPERPLELGDDALVDLGDADVFPIEPPPDDDGLTLIDDGAVLDLEDDDSLVEFDDAELVQIDDDLLVQIDDDALVQIDDDALVQIDEDALVQIDDDALVQIDDDASLIELDDDAPLVDFESEGALVDFTDDASLDLSDDSFVDFDAEPLVEYDADDAEPSTDDDLASLISIEEPEARKAEVLTYDDSGNLVGDDDTPSRGASGPAPDDLSKYISWSDEPIVDDSPPTAAEVEETLVIDDTLADTLSDALVLADDEALDVLDAELFEDDDGDANSFVASVRAAAPRAPEPVVGPTDSDVDDDDDDGFGDFEDEEVTFIADVGDIDRLREKATAGVRVAAPEPTRGAAVQVGRPVTAGLYGGPSLPTIREGHEPRPRAAAIQINAATGTGKVIGLEDEDEPIAIGDIGDYSDEAEEEDDYDFDSEGGFRVALQEYEEEEDDGEEEAAEPTPQPAPPRVTFTAPEPQRGEIDGMFQKAEEAASVGDMQLGADIYSDVLDLDPEHTRAYVGRGRLYLDLGDYTRAMSDFMTAEEIAPKDPEPQIAIGDLFFARKDYRKAITYFNAALDVAPNHAMAFCRRGISHYYRKNYTVAMDDLVRARKLNTDIPNIETYIAMAKKKAKR